MSSVNRYLFDERINSKLVGNVSSSFRVNPFTKKPLYVSKADGPKIYDIDNKEYIDFFMGHGAALLGHNRPEVMQAVKDSLKLGFTAEFDCKSTLELSNHISEHLPSMELMRYTNSGSESTLLAMRLARGYTNKELIIRLDGHFHGNHDYVLFNNLALNTDNSNKGGKESKKILASKGIPVAVQDSIIIIPWKDIDAFKYVVKKYKDKIAGIILNVIDYNNGCIFAEEAYLREMVSISNENDIVVIFDEILSGFKTGLSCGQGYFNVKPDLTTLGKSLSNGVPLGVIGGKAEIMNTILDKPLPVVSGGTYSGNLLGVSAALASLSVMSKNDFYPPYLEMCQYFYKELNDTFIRLGFPAKIQSLGAGFYIYVGTQDEISNYSDFSKIDFDLATRFFTKCIEGGVYFHTDFTISAMHTYDLLDKALYIMEKAAKSLVRK